MDNAELTVQERSFRTQVLLRELGYTLSNIHADSTSWSSTFIDGMGFTGTAVIDSDQRFLELACPFSFSTREQDFLRRQMDSLMRICYQYGCYFTILTEMDEIIITLFSKLYFSGLQYYALEETCGDLKNAVEELRKLFDLRYDVAEGETDGHP